MPDREDWLLAPVHAGLIKAESLMDGTIDLAFVALLNDSIAVRSDNEELARQEAERRREK